MVRSHRDGASWPTGSRIQISCRPETRLARNENYKRETEVVRLGFPRLKKTPGAPPSLRMTPLKVIGRRNRFLGSFRMKTGHILRVETENHASDSEEVHIMGRLAIWAQLEAK